MSQDTMVAEYRGVRLRREVADRREDRYRREGKDCYLFAVSDDCVIDSTMRGTISRFTVRPASGPCCLLTHGGNPGVAAAFSWHTQLHVGHASHVGRLLRL